MMFESALAELCSLGLRSNQQHWTAAILEVRQGVDDGSKSPQWAGHLGMLLLLGGRGDRAVQIFDMLADTIKPRFNGSNGNGVRLGWEGRAVHWPPDRPGLQTETNLDTKVLAALVLSGRWAQARRCCRELVQ